ASPGPGDNRPPRVDRVLDVVAGVQSVAGKSTRSPRRRTPHDFRPHSDSAGLAADTPHLQPTFRTLAVLGFPSAWPDRHPPREAFQRPGRPARPVCERTREAPDYCGQAVGRPSATATTTK